MNSEWMDVIETIGYEAAEKLRKRYLGERIRVPSMTPRNLIVPIIKKELRDSTYKELAKKYGLSERSIRRYESWEIKDDCLTSPSGRKYYLNSDDISL
jgi:response regulator of citrate/malate metabolism